MPISFGRTPGRSLRQPSLKRISLPTADRLTTIIEGPGAPPAIPRRSSRRNSISHSETNSLRRSHRASDSAASVHNSPPPYEWVPEPLPSRDEDEVAFDEQLEKLRQADRGEGRQQRRWKRGGFVRVILIGLAVIIILAIALGVGLGVGLKKNEEAKQQQQNQQQGQQPQTNGAGQGGTPNSNTTYIPPQKFPLGEYSLDTVLRSVSTDCTSNAATWSCFPYFVYADGNTNDTSFAIFNWIISNTSEYYATYTSPATTSAGVPANLTVSTTNDPFGITFAPKPLTYISSSTNSSAARFTFDFTMSRQVIPSSPITTDGTNAECFFNQTIFTANLYLAATRMIFPGGDTPLPSIGGFPPWPFAVEIQQTAAGGENVPNCYSSANGEPGAPVTSGLKPQPTSAECVCQYQNY